MGGQVQQQQQANAAAATGTAFYDNAAGGGDTGDAVMARWLQSNGLQHLASPLASSAAIDQRLLPNLLMQGYGAQSADEKQRLFKLMRNLNFNGESASEPYTPNAQTSSASEGFYTPDFRGDFGAGLLDLHAMDDTGLLSEDVMSEPFEPSPFIPGVSKGFENDFNLTSGRPQKEQLDPEQSGSFRSSDKESTKESNVAKIKVVVRKRPLNKKELSRKEEDVVSVCMNSLTVHEPKLKVDLTAYVEKHEFCFDAVIDEQVTNNEVYRVTVEPIIPTIFQRTKATCFAYGQTVASNPTMRSTIRGALKRERKVAKDNKCSLVGENYDNASMSGSGKTFTMQPLPLRAAQDLVRILRQPVYHNQRFKLWLSYFEIYGGKLFDLLSDRKKLCMREDGRQQVCIVGLQEFEVSDVQLVKEYIEKGNATRSTGSTGANEESSRSHAILQLVIKKHPEVKETRRNADANETKSGKVVGKISFIDLAGSERGADTTDNDRQTRIEGAEINKSLLALKECIRALDNDQIHIPFRGSKLTEVLRDSFVGNSRTVMISCISPNAGSCEHTLNTLRYADRVKSLSKNGNAKKDPVMSSLPLTSKDITATSSVPISTDTGEDYVPEQDAKPVNFSKRLPEKETLSYNPTNDYDKLPSSSTSSYPFNGGEERGLTGALDRERFENAATTYSGSTSQKLFSTQPQKSFDTEENVQKVSPPRRKAPREEKSEKFGSFLKKDGGSDLATANFRQQYASSSGTPRDEKAEKYGSFLKKDGRSDVAATNSRQQNTSASSEISMVGSRKYEPDLPPEGKINAILEEEEALFAAHRKEIENTMEIVREEMKLLAEVDQPGSQIDNYVTQLSFVLSRKAAGLVSLQARLARFQHRLKEQEILSRKRVPR